MIDLTIRSFSKARWVTVATGLGILRTDGTPSVGYSVDEVGDAQLDGWFWVNVRVDGVAAATDIDALYAGDTDAGLKFQRSKIVKFFRDQALVVNITVAGQSVKTYEFGSLANRIEILDPASYAAVKQREWLGGMRF
jgi:hypothetical protein